MKLIKLLFIPFILVGCWDSVEINNRSVILEFAIDKNIDTMDETVPINQRDVYDITYSIPDMAKMSGTESLAKDMKTNILVKSPTIATSLEELEIRTRNTVTFSHVKVVFLGEELLKDPKLLKEAIDSMTRTRSIARNVPMLAVKGKTEDAMNIENTQQPILGLYIMNYFNNKERPEAYFKTQILGNFIRDIQDSGVATMPIFHLPEGGQIPDTNKKSDDGAEKYNNEEEDNNTEDNKSEGEDSKSDDTVGEKNDTGFEISGGAVIKDYKLVDYIDKEIVRGQLIIDGSARNIPVVVEHNDNPLTYLAKRVKTKINFGEINNTMHAIINVNMIGEIAEYTTEFSLNEFNPSNMEEIRKLLSDEVYKQIEMTVNKAHELNTDFLNIGLTMYRKNPDMWEKYKHNWQESAFQNMPVYVNIDIDIENTGILR
ncbi:MAG: hypothetical protein BEN19_06345 [Epulopiscium sp. Nuni2H_MBin003]|nr:MAG: hypothetical protein BEN19_06345 [Epulopiscium sp. Nuni2H_MBin003]